MPFQFPGNHLALFRLVLEVADHVLRHPATGPAAETAQIRRNAKRWLPSALTEGDNLRIMDVDTRCFLKAFVDVCGFSDVDPDWSRYRNTTDAGIFEEVFESRRNRGPTTSEIVEFRDYLVRLFRLAALQKPFAPIRGAPQLLARLKKLRDYRVGLAGGSWPVIRRPPRSRRSPIARRSTFSRKGTGSTERQDRCL